MPVYELIQCLNDILKVAKLAGCGLVWTAATNDLSRLLFSKLGLSEIRRVRWAEFEDEEGRRPFEGKNVASEAVTGMYKVIA